MKKKIIDISIVLLVGWALYLLDAYMQESAVSTNGWNNLKYFTVQSNVLMGIISIWNLISNKDHPYFILAGTVSVALTALTVAVFLGPVFGWEIMYISFNLYMHAIIPALALVRFIIARTGKEIEFSKVWTGLIPMILYGIVYGCNILINGVSHQTDWYGFAMWGKWSIIPVYAVILGITYLMSLLIWKLGGGKKG